MTRPARARHELKGGTLYIEDNGVIGRCTCGWTTGHRFSGMIASVAFREHKETSVEVRARGRKK